MKVIATDVEDSAGRLREMVDAQQRRPGLAIDPYFYRSHVAYRRELESIVFRSWIYAGHISQIPESGDYFLYEIGEDSLIVTRDEQGQVRALMNTCRHRGSRVCFETSGHRKTFVCPYHGWVYDTTGALKGARHMEALAGFDKKDYGLRQARVVVRHGLIFINCDAEAFDFNRSLDLVESRLAPYHLKKAKIAHRHVYKVDANWKLALENYLECYHCATSHRNYARSHTLMEPDIKVAHLNEAMWERSERMTGIPGISDSVEQFYGDAPGFGACIYNGRYALYEGFQTGSRDGKPVAPLMGDFKGFDGGAGDFQFGPLSFMLNYPDHCVLYRFTPRGLTSTDMEIVWFVDGDAEEGQDYRADDVSWLWHHTSLEDEFIIMRNSEGVNSHFFVPGPYHPEFERTSMGFIDWYLRALA